MELHDRMEDQAEFLALESVPQVRLHTGAGLRRLAHDDVEHSEARTPLLLGVIHGKVRVVQQVLGLRVAGPAQRHADAGRRDDLPAFERHRRGERVLDAARRVLRVGRTDDVLEQYGELVAPEPRHDVARPNARSQASRELRQQAVAGRVAEVIVDRLELVGIDEQDREPVIRIPSPARQGLRHALDQVSTVRQIGQRVVQRRVQQLLLDTLALRDIVGNRRGADDLAVRVEDRRDGERDLDVRAVLAHPGRLFALAALHALEDAAYLVDAVWGSEQGDRLPDHLLGGVPVQAGRGRVPAGDDPVYRLADDGVLGGLHHRLELRQGQLGHFALRDVAREAARMDELTAVKPRARTDETVTDRAVAAAQARLDVWQGLAGPQAPQGVRRDLRIDVERGDVLPHVLLAAVAEHLELGLVGAENRAVRPRPTPPDRRVLDEVLELSLPAARLYAGPLAIAHVYGEADHSDDRASVVPQRLHARVVVAVGQPDLVGDRLARERLPVHVDRLGRPFAPIVLPGPPFAHHAAGQQLQRFGTGPRPRSDA